MNCFMIYKRDKKHAILASNPMINFRDISKIVADQWREESAEVKEHYKNLAKIEMKNHQEKYPDYRFPSSKGKHGKKKAKGLAESLFSNDVKKKSVGRPRKEVTSVSDDKNEKLQEYIARLKNINGINFQDVPGEEVKKEEGFNIPDGSDAIYKHRVLPPLIQNRGFIPKGEKAYFLPRPLPNLGSLPVTLPVATRPPVPLSVSTGVTSVAGLMVPNTTLLDSPLVAGIPNVSQGSEENEENVKIEKQKDLGECQEEKIAREIQRVVTPSTPVYTSYSTPMAQKSLATPESILQNFEEGSQFKSVPMAISEIYDSPNGFSNSTDGNNSYFINESLNESQLANLPSDCKSYFN